VEAIGGLAAARPAPKVSLLLDQVRFWERGGIVWAGCHVCPPELAAWVEDLHGRARRMGFSVERREFKPHITLLRNAHRRPGVRTQPLPWTVTRLCLYESHISSAGSEYRELYSWPTATLM
jgi:2'-5' RNA ligase